MPALIENRPVQPSFLAHLSSGFSHRAFSAGDHALGVEGFKNDGSEPLGQIKTCSVVPVLADAGASCAQSSHTAPGLGVSITTPFAAAKHPLGAPLASFEGFKVGRNGKQLTRGQSNRIRHAPINADAGGQGRRGVMLNSQSKGNMPAVRGKVDCDVVHLSTQLARVTKPHPSDLGQTDFRPLAGQFTNLNLTAMKAKRVVQTFLARTRIFGETFEPVLAGTVEVAQSLLLTGLRDYRNPIILVTDAVPRLALEGSPMGATLIQSEVVNQTAHSSKLREKPFLLRRGLKFETIAAVDHSTRIAIFPRVANMDYKTGRHVVYMLHVHLVFVTKYRRDVLSEPAIRDLRHIFTKICRNYEAELIECDGEDDHVHLLVHYPPKVAFHGLLTVSRAYQAACCAKTALKLPGAITRVSFGPRHTLQQVVAVPHCP